MSDEFPHLLESGVAPDQYAKENVGKILSALNRLHQHLNKNMKEKRTDAEVKKDSVRRVKTDYTLGAGDPPILGDAGDGAFSIRLPHPSGQPGLIYLKNQGTTNDITLSPESGMIDGNPDHALAPGDGAILLDDGDGYTIVGRI